MHTLNEKNRAIGEMFSSIAARYDLLNRLLSLGRDRSWRRAAVAAAVPKAGGFYMDVATGTADVALELLRQKGAGARVVGVDISLEMMWIGAGKAEQAGRGRDVSFIRAPGESLPFCDGAFDSSLIAFGIRNVADRAKALSEMCRVVRPGGRVVVLEFSRPESRLFGPLYRLYFTRVLPRIAGLLSRRSAYTYLPESVLAFPSPDEFSRAMRDAGCREVTFRPLTFGIVTLYVGVR